MNQSKTKDIVIRASIVGPTGYTSLFLMRWLLRHPNVQITCLASRREQPLKIHEEFPELAGKLELATVPINTDALLDASDVIFLCLPHKASMSYCKELLQAAKDAGRLNPSNGSQPLKVIDLSADYRLKDQALYESVYETPHDDPENIPVAAYGLPELFRDEIKGTHLIANPGCYPTAAALGISPLIKAGLVQTDDVVVNATSGVSGAGRSAKPHLHFPEANEAFMPYGIGVHRHQPEIGQTLSHFAGKPMHPLFVPHLLPVNQGILETIYLKPVNDDVTEDQLKQAFKEAYQDEPFVRYSEAAPNLKNVVNSNFCDVTCRLVGEKEKYNRRVVVISAIDNMMKGASGQAIQNMNLVYGLEETTGLI